MPLISKEIPKGYDLLQLTGTLVHEALAETSPALAVRRHLFMTQAQFVDSVEEVQNKERKDRTPDKLILFNRLISAGVPRAELEGRYFQVSSELPVYINPEKPEFLTIKRVLTRFSLFDVEERIRVAAAFGGVFAKAILRTLPYLDNPYYDGRISSFMEPRLRAIMLDDFDEYWQALKGKYKSPNTKKGFNEAEKKLDRLLKPLNPNRKPRAIPVGAMLVMLLPGQTLASSEYLVGQRFNDGVIEKMMASFKVRFWRRMQQALGIPMQGSYKPLPQQIEAEGNLRQIGLSKEPDTIQAYLESLIPIRHLQAEDNPHVNIWAYPSGLG